MDLARSTSRFEALTPLSLGYRMRSIWVLLTRSGKLAAWCESASGWLLCGAIAVSPWLTAGIDPWSIRLLAAWLSLAAGLWAAARWYGRPFDLPWSWRILAGLIAAIVATCIASILHASNGYHPIEHVLVRPVAPSQWLPSTVYRRGSAEWLLQVGPVLALLAAMADLARSFTWQRRFLTSLAASGAMVAAYGCLQHMHLAPRLVLSEASDVKFLETIFAAFRKHGNAGAWLNLALPAAIGLAVISVGTRRRVWIAAAGMITTGALVNVSKIASALAIAIVVVAAMGLIVRGGVTDWRSLYHRVFKIVVLPVLLLLAFVLVTGRMSMWAKMPDTLSENSGRRIIWRASAAMAKDAGAFGHGAGTFKVLLPTTPHLDHTVDNGWAVTKYAPGTAISQWMYPCNDLLQSLIEWGPLGTAAGLLIPLGAGVGLVLARRRTSDPHRRVVTAVALLALLVVAFHAMGDYPLQILSIQIAVCVYLAIGWSMLAPERDPLVVAE